MSLNTLDKNY